MPGVGDFSVTTVSLSDRYENDSGIKNVEAHQNGDSNNFIYIFEFISSSSSGKSPTIFEPVSPHD